MRISLNIEHICLPNNRLKYNCKLNAQNNIQYSMLSQMLREIFYFDTFSVYNVRCQH